MIYNNNSNNNNNAVHNMTTIPVYSLFGDFF